eukprot:TRINITY_DN3066_c1_g1_i1.p1 TRINITY_DN3066_c1_g1~~TRINITY_DN3066_c1_g1_i1.p1  ORF type:complete len:327 (-),score=84.66 TRINITY_DN3066_c1_g1_i1:393-1373(-)
MGDKPGADQQGGMPGGVPPGGMPFDLQAMQEMFSSDPAFKEMAEKMAQDPAIKQMTEQLQQSFASMMGGAEQGPEPPGNPFDNTAMAGYADVMKTMFENPEFMKMAETLGQNMMQRDPMLKQMMEAAQDPEYKRQIEEKMQSMREDPELKHIIEELEKSGPQAMMKYMNDPKVMQKMGSLWGDQMAALGESSADVVEGGEDGIHGAASAGDAEALRKLVAKEGVNLEEKDDEGRTALHFASGYGEHECMQVLLDAGAKVEEVDNNQNTALHYAAGYGQKQACEILLKYNASVSAKNADGKMPGEVAQLNEQKEISEMLAKHANASK